MSSAALLVLVSLSALIFWVGAVKLVFIPLSLIFEIRDASKRRHHGKTVLDEQPLVSIIVPGYNEEKVLDACVTSILRNDYENFELILVNDGSTDATGAVMQRWAHADSRIVFVDQPNSGKGAALNNGTAHSRGEFLLYVDADGVFAPQTISEMLRAFDSKKVGAVSGDDRPVNLDRVLTKVLALISHVGTGFIRRALSTIHALPVVSGNIGMFRRSVLKVTGPLRTDTLGEDLELTWRMHRAGFVVKFAPRAVVYAESPSTLAGLWRQRVRWARGMVQATVIHWRMISNVRYGFFGLFLLFNLTSMIVVPVAQILVLLGIPYLIVFYPDTMPQHWLGWLGFIGVFSAFALLVYSIVLNRAWGDLRHVWVFPLWPVYTTFIGLTLVWGLGQELLGVEKSWNKLDRTGTISVSGLRLDSPLKPQT